MSKEKIVSIVVANAKMDKSANRDNAYLYYKRQVERIGLSCEEYEKAIRKICDALNY